MSLLSRTLLLSTCMLSLMLEAGAAQEPAAPDWHPVAEEIQRLVRTHYIGEGGENWAFKYDVDTNMFKTDHKRFVEITKRRIGDLKMSHTGYYAPDDPEYYGLRAIFRETNQEKVEWDSIGADFTPDGFVRVVFAGSPAAKAGLWRGDQVLKADGQIFHRVRSFQGKVEKQVTLTVQREKDGTPITVNVTPRRINPKQEWLEAQIQGSRLIPHQGKTIAYVPMFSCAGEEYQQALRNAIIGELQKADALILDFRDGWGGANPDFVNLFHRATPVLTQTGRDGKEVRFDAQWRKPAFLLINGGSRSGKEVVAYAVKKHKLGVLVGERTAGAVAGGRIFRLTDGSILYLAVAKVLVDGERLEGVGVEPDVVVKDDLRFANGRDVQLQNALDLAAKRGHLKALVNSRCPC